jgi:hypothetical protein
LKKLLFITLLLSLNLTSYAQWETYEYVDDFGDATGDTFEYFQTTGLFSNSATTNSECGFLVKHDEGESYSISIYPYNRNTKERWTKGTFQNVLIKTPSGEVEEINTFASKTGVLLFSNEDYQSLKTVMEQKGKHILVLKYEGDYSSSKYKFEFDIQ